MTGTSKAQLPGQGRGKWWSKGRGLEPEVYDSLVTSLSAQPGRLSHPAPDSKPRILAWARSPQGVVVGLPAQLCVYADGDWTKVGWHTIEKGGWNTETGQLQWTLYGGRRGSIALLAPARLPELFRERVAASIAVDHFEPVAGTRGGVVVSGRRDLGDTDAPLSWHCTLSKGVTWRTAGVQATADAVLALLRSEYDN